MIRPVVALLDGRAAHLAARQLAARAAGEQTGPTAPVEHADGPRAAVDRVAQRVGERGAEEPESRLLVALVDHLDPRPRACGTGRRSARPSATTASTVGAGVSTRTAAPTRAARSNATSRAFHVGARSSSSASSPSSSTTTAARSGTGAHTALRPPITTHAPARARAQCAVRAASGCSDPRSTTSRPSRFPPRCERRGARRRRVDHQRRPLRRERHVELADAARRHAARRPAAERPGYTAVSTSTGSSTLTTLGGDAARRKRQRSGPAPRGPAAEVDDVGRWTGRRHREHLAQVARLRAARPRRRAPTRAPADRATARARPSPTRDRARADDRESGSR